MNDKKAIAAKETMNDLVFLLGGTMENRAIEGYRNPEVELPGARVVELLNKTFSTLDPNDDGISRSEVTDAMIHPEKFSVDEYSMLKLIAKYFDTIINLSDDEVAEETVITQNDAKALGESLLNSQFTLSEFHRWLAISSGNATENDIGPPPTSLS
jgi:hypothetical protein